jgi:hypothetical protein
MSKNQKTTPDRVQCSKTANTNAVVHLQELPQQELLHITSFLATPSELAVLEGVSKTMLSFAVWEPCLQQLDAFWSTGFKPMAELEDTAAIIEIQSYFTASGVTDSQPADGPSAEFMDPRIKLATPAVPDWADTITSPKDRTRLLIEHVKHCRDRLRSIPDKQSDCFCEMFGGGAEIEFTQVHAPATSVGKAVVISALTNLWDRLLALGGVFGPTLSSIDNPHIDFLFHPTPDFDSWPTGTCPRDATFRLIRDATQEGIQPEAVPYVECWMVGLPRVPAHPSAFPSAAICDLPFKFTGPGQCVVS